MATKSSSKIDQTATVPKGFQFAGVTCGIKASGKPDLALIVGDGPLVSAGVYTTNQIVAAPVLLCRKRTPASRRVLAAASLMTYVRFGKMDPVE